MRSCAFWRPDFGELAAMPPERLFSEYDMNLFT